KGCESFYRDKHMRYPRPDGGDGAKGGDIVFVAKRSIQTLLDFKFKQHYKAEKGGNASSGGRTGRTGKDCFLFVPCGTIIKDDDTGLVIKDLTKDEQSVIVARGGIGGWGNGEHKTIRPPKNGEKRFVRLELKLIADVGLIGFPNAGKSTLITSVSKVKSKIANYPFTTKQPILGIVPGDDFSFVIADLPGLIEGAHEGKGLGDRFLRHAERTKILVHMVDMAGTEMRDPIEDYEKINHEIYSYSDQFMIKHKLLVANKMDLPEAKKNLNRFRERVKEDIIPLSAHTQEGVDELISRLRELLCQENSQEK
ncbi:MAG: Obg family GTPase CgtA, partial [Candidatus Omnitrophica bacterium]|nr:Obg family GTPase CgtA [Candidatus Omnitrophota bacterium]